MIAVSRSSTRKNTSIQQYWFHAELQNYAMRPGELQNCTLKHTYNLLWHSTGSYEATAAVVGYTKIVYNNAVNRDIG